MRDMLHTLAHTIILAAAGILSISDTTRARGGIWAQAKFFFSAREVQGCLSKSPLRQTIELLPAMYQRSRGRQSEHVRRPLHSDLSTRLSLIDPTCDTPVNDKKHEDQESQLRERLTFDSMPCNVSGSWTFVI
jgi:hypothetical protein